MIPGILIVLGLLYAATAVVFYLHEVGHYGDKINFELKLPLPKAWSYQSRFQYGGLAVNAAIFFAVWQFQPDILFLQVVGLTAWLHFIWYLIWGSFNYEPKIPKWMWEFWVFDDVSNEHWFIAVPVAIWSFFYFKAYYVPVIINLLGMV